MVTPGSLLENPIKRAVPVVLLVGLDISVASAIIALALSAFLAGNLPETVYMFVPATNFDLTYENCVDAQTCTLLVGDGPFGGALNFTKYLQFIASTALPATLPSISVGKISLAGWGLGGLFACYAATQTAALSSVLCASPFLWWNHYSFPNMLVQAQSAVTASVSISFGSGEVEPTPLIPVLSMVQATTAAFGNLGLTLGVNLTVLVVDGGTASPAGWYRSAVDSFAALLGQPQDDLTAAWIAPTDVPLTTTTTAPGACVCDTSGMYSSNVLVGSLLAVFMFDLVLFVLAWFKPWVWRESAKRKK